MTCLQEANKQVPGMPDTLCLAAKAWSDACYLDEIQSPYKERLTMQDRHDVNKKAMEYAKQVGLPCCLHLNLVFLPVQGVKAYFQARFEDTRPAYTCP